MKHTTLFCLVVAFAAFAGNAQAIYKCTTAKGVVYQDRPCREGNETDVQIVVPTGEVAPKQMPAPDNGPQANGTPVESRPPATKSGRTSVDDPATVVKPIEKRASESSATASDAARKKEAQTGADNPGSSMVAEQAQKTEPSAKYYTSDGFGIGTDTPGRLTCESATGEKRVFYLSNGKLTSI